VIAAADLVTAAEVDDMRGDLALGYTDRAEIRRLPPPAQRRDRSGGSTASEGDSVAFAACRLARGNQPAREQAIASAQTGVTSATFYTAPPAADPNARILPSDRVVITSTIDPNEPPVFLEVQSAEVRRSINVEQVVTCLRIGDAPPPPIVPLQT
jgi:hypothetical protein